MIVADVAGGGEHSRPSEPQLLVDPAQAAYSVYFSQHASEVVRLKADQIRDRVHVSGKLRHRRRSAQKKPLQAAPVETQFRCDEMFRPGQADPGGEEARIVACRRHDQPQVHITR